MSLLIAEISLKNAIFGNAALGDGGIIYGMGCILTKILKSIPPIDI